MNKNHLKNNIMRGKNMSIKLFYFLITILVISILIGSCNDLTTPDSLPIEFVSFKDEGCTSDNSLQKITDEAILNWKYLNGRLQLEFLFSTHCSASCKDSIVISADTINIFLADTNQFVAKCSCQRKEAFEFEINGYDQLQIIFNYKPITKPEYFKLIDMIIRV